MVTTKQETPVVLGLLVASALNFDIAIDIKNQFILVIFEKLFVYIILIVFLNLKIVICHLVSKF